MSTSNPHRLIGRILFSSSIFSHYRILEEYPVVKVNPLYGDNSHRFDWVILDLKLVIEVHGEQHYRPVRFGGVSIEEAILNYNTQQWRDNRKQRAAEDAGWVYLSIPHWDLASVDSNYILDHYLNEVKKLEPSIELVDQKEVKRKEKEREYRRAAYRKWKQQGG